MNLPALLSRSALALTLGLGLMAPSLAAAQGGPQRDGVGKRDCRGPHGHGRRGHHGRALQRITQQLDLTDNQRLQIETIFESARDRRRELRQQGRSEQTREQMRELRQETRQLVRDVLTPAQRQELKQLRKERHERMVDRRIERMTEHLELTEGQARQIRRIFEQKFQKKQQLRDSNAGREQMRELFEQTHEAVRQVLNDEQRAEMDRFLERRRGRRGGPGGRGPR